MEAFLFEAQPRRALLARQICGGQSAQAAEILSRFRIAGAECLLHRAEALLLRWADAIIGEEMPLNNLHDLLFSRRGILRREPGGAAGVVHDPHDFLCGARAAVRQFLQSDQKNRAPCSRRPDVISHLQRLALTGQLRERRFVAPFAGVPKS